MLIIKNVSSSTSHKKNPSLRLSLREFKKILPSTFIYQPILIKKNCMNANIMNSQIFNLFSQKVTFIFKSLFLLEIFFV